MVAYDWSAEANHIPRTEYAKTTWREASPSRPCPICEHVGWCAIADDGSAAICMRVSDGAVKHIDLGHGVGHVHKLDGSASIEYPTFTPAPRAVADSPLDFDAIMARWRKHTPADAISDLAKELGVSRDSLTRLDVVYCPERKAFAFPMRNEHRKIVGIRLRRSDGSKFALPRSRSGAFVPTEIDAGPLLVCEGPTDTAAALSLGFSAVGRASCTGSSQIIAEIAKRRQIVIVPDADGPGLYGAESLANRLAAAGESVKIVRPKPPHKDLRGWVNDGAKRAILQRRIDTASNITTADALDAIAITEEQSVITFLRVELITPRKKEVLRVASRLEIGRREAFGLIFDFWCYVAVHAKRGVLDGMTCEDLDAALEQAGASEALLSAGWLAGENGALTVPNWEKYFSLEARKKALNAEAQRRRRVTE